MRYVPRKRPPSKAVEKSAKPQLRPDPPHDKKFVTRLISVWTTVERGTIGAVASTLKGAFKNTAGLALAAVSIGIAWFMVQALVLRWLRPEHMIVVQPFQSSADGFKDLALTGQNAADIVVDEFNTNVNNAMEFSGYESHPRSPHFKWAAARSDNTNAPPPAPTSAGASHNAHPRPPSEEHQSSPTPTQSRASQLHYGSVDKLIKIPAQSSYGITFNGISLDMLVQIYDRIRYSTWEISGDITGGSDAPLILMRLTTSSGSSQWFFPPTRTGQSKEAFIWQLRGAADQVLEAWDPEIMTRAYLQEGKYRQAERIARSWSQAEPGNSEPGYFIVLGKLYEGLQCFETSCTQATSTSSAPTTKTQHDPTLTDYEEALALAQWERERVSQRSIWGRLFTRASKTVADNTADRLEDSIADIDLTVCADALVSPCDAYLTDADKRYSALASKYANDENIAVNYASVKVLENNSRQAIVNLQNFEQHYPADVIFYFNKAKTEDLLKDISAEIDDYRQALKSDPSNVESQTAFLNALTERATPQDAAEAVSTYRWLAAIVPPETASSTAAESAQNQNATDLKIDYAWGLARTGNFISAEAELKPVLGTISISTVDEFAESFRTGNNYAPQALDLVQARIAAINSKTDDPNDIADLFTEAAKLETAAGDKQQAAADSARAATALKGVAPRRYELAK